MAGKLADAVESWKHCLELDPIQPDPYLNLGITHDRQGRVADAIEAYQSYLRLVGPSRRRAEIDDRIRELSGETDSGKPNGDAK
jgi:tetratricopeptide (TPR) repeat protein